MIEAQRQEAQRIRMCLEQEKQRLIQLQQQDDEQFRLRPPGGEDPEKYRIRQIQKDALYSYFNKVSIQVGDYVSGQLLLLRLCLCV